MTMTIDVISDVICPWCYVGKRRLEKAVTLAGIGGMQVRWHPFQLNPQMPKEGMNRSEYRTAKFGSWERSLALDCASDRCRSGGGHFIRFRQDRADAQYVRRPPAYWAG